MKVVNHAVRKKDAMALVTGQGVYTDDIAPRDCLCVKLLRSPHAFARVLDVKTEAAMRLPGVECVLWHKDMPGTRFTCAGQTYPEFSPYDRLILDEYARFVGDPVAIVAAVDERTCEKALRAIRVTYEVLTPVLDPHCAKDNPVLVHPEENWHALCDVGADNKRNLCASGSDAHGDVEGVLALCEVVLEHTYHIKAVQQAMMETFRAYTQLDAYGRLEVVSSTQIPFHVRRILATALEIPKARVRVVKPRIGGGFGAKQTAVCEMYPAIVTMKTGKRAKIVFTREESQIASSPRHDMEVRVRVGAMRDGTLRAIDLYTLSCTGAYGEHGPTTVGLSGHKSIPLYRTEAFHFGYDVVYVNRMSAGAYRGYGATQGIFALESMMDELAKTLEMDPVALREKNMVRQGDVMPAYYGETANSCTLDRCVARAKAMIDWDTYFPRRVMPDGKIRAVGMAMAMQGSGISAVDVGSVTIKIADGGQYNLAIGATDMGTGCDTILAQMAADCMDCDVDDIAVQGVDTDVSPYDSGSYASSTTYVTGMAVVKACAALRERIVRLGAQMLSVSPQDAEFDGKQVYAGDKRVSIADIATRSMLGAQEETLQVTASHSSQISPPPFMAGAALIEVDPDTGAVELLDYAAVVDCGTAINPALARVQVEGGVMQGIGMALTEDVRYDAQGRNMSNSFLQYKLPTRLDAKCVRVEFEESYEPTGPFGAKSIGEIVINTPAPAICNALHHATGVRIRELPICAEAVWTQMEAKKA